MRSILFVILLALSGCQTVAPVSLTLPANFSEKPTGGIQRPPERWWLAFRDDGLDALAMDGLRGNLDIAQAQARLLAAQANITVAGAGGLPSLNLGLQHLTERETGKMKTVDGITRTASVGASASWLIDLFGESRSQTASARASRDAAVAGTDVARLALISNIISAYIDVRYYQERTRIARSALAARRKTLALTRGMRAQGTASDLDVAQAQGQVEAVGAEIPGYDASFLKAAHRIATLTGRPASALLADLRGKTGQPLPAWRADAGVPADLTRNRPDVRRAESELASAMADVGVARAQLFPTITLSGSITPSYVRSSLGNGGLTTWSFGPTLRLPIFDGGRLRANVAVTVARAREKQANWQARVLAAVEEVENALVDFNRDQQATLMRQARVDSAQRAFKLSNAAYGAGVLSLLDVIEIERALYDAEAALADSRRNLALHFVALKVAAGYGLSGPGAGAVTTAGEACDPQAKAATCPTKKRGASSL